MHSTEVPLEFLKAMEKRSTLTVELGANPFRRPPKDITTMGVAEAITWWEDVHCSGEGFFRHGRIIQGIETEGYGAISRPSAF